MRRRQRKGTLARALDIGEVDYFGHAGIVESCGICPAGPRASTSIDSTMAELISRSFGTLLYSTGTDTIISSSGSLATFSQMPKADDQRKKLPDQISGQERIIRPSLLWSQSSPRAAA